jgi:hypothetical protein
MHHLRVVPIGRTQTAMCQPTQGGHDGNLLLGTQIQSLRMSGPLGGVLGSVSCWPPFVSPCPSLFLLWAVLTQLEGFDLDP